MIIDKLILALKSQRLQIREVIITVSLLTKNTKFSHKEQYQ